MSNSIQYTASYDNLANVINNMTPTTELGVTNNQRIITSGEKPTGIFSSAKMFFRAFFRPQGDILKTDKVYDQVSKDIKNLFGTKAAKQFNHEMKYKKAEGSPLTQGALMRFMKSEGLKLDKLST